MLPLSCKRAGVLLRKRFLTVTRFELARETHHGFGHVPKRDAVTTWLHCRDKWLSSKEYELTQLAL